MRDVTEDSFTAWREKSRLSPKTVNDLLSNMRAFFNWMKRRRLIVADPLEHVRKVSNDSPGNFRRALSVDEINRLLSVAPAHRATGYVPRCREVMQRKGQTIDNAWFAP